MPSWMPVIIYAVIVLVFLAFYAWAHMDDSIGRRPFVLIAFLTILMLVTDLVSRCFIYDGVPHLLVFAATLVTFLSMPAIGVVWARYVRSVLIAEERQKMNVLNFAIYGIAAIATFIVLATPVTSWVYYFDDAGSYYRGTFFILPAAATFITLLITTGFLLLHVRSLQRYSIRMLAAFVIPPAVGAVLAMVVPDVPWIPLGVSVSIVALYAHIQNTGMGRDYLTGLFNRKKLEELFEERVERAHSGHPFAAIMMDIDGFKQVNDTQGHAVGDVVLAETARLLQRSVRASDAIARFGGDEFFVLLDMEDGGELEGIVARIVQEEEEAFNREERPYKIRLSKGYDFYDAEKFPSIKEFEGHLDELMYADKRRHHAHGQEADAGASLSAGA